MSVDRAPRFERLDRLFSQLIDEPPERRTVTLAKLRRESPELAFELEILLRCDGESGRFLGAAAEDARDELLARALAARGRESAGEDLSGQRLGPFELTKLLGRGVHATVYRARRVDEDWDQEVAIKILGHSLGSDDAVRRFLAERQILSQLRHPNIARVLDGGITTDGRPFFVMEYVDGAPISEYCRDAGTSLQERVRLVADVCRAVAHAHRHLVVHRDIKPANILVNDRGGVVLLDFGIAKLLGAALPDDREPLTVDAVRPMTPRYASPEQRNGEPITSATDVYQLGLLLTGLLTGAQHPREALGIGGSGHVEHVPSRCTGGNDAALPYPRRQIRGDLDWIVLKCVQPRPQDRYGSASELLADLENYLAARPVQARRRTGPYVVGKFVRRRPAISAALALLVVAAVAFMLTLSQFNRELALERQAALDAAARAEEVKDLLVGFIAAPDPFAGVGADARVSQVLLNSEQTIETELVGRPALQAELYGTLGDVYQNLFLHERALNVLSRQRTLRRQLGIPTGPEDLRILRKEAESRMALGDTDRAVEELSGLRKRLAREFPEAWQERARVDLQLGHYYAIYGQAEDALSFLERAAVQLEGREGAMPLRARLEHEIGVAYGYMGEFETAAEHFQAAYALRREHQGPAHVETLMEQAEIAANLTSRGQFPASIAIYAEVIAGLERKLGPLHGEVLTLLNNQAVSHDLDGNLGAAVDMHVEVLKRTREKYGGSHRQVADSLQNVGSVLSRAGRHEEAIAALQEAARMYLEVNEPGHPRNAYPHISLAILYAELDDVDRLEAHARTALDMLDGNVASDSPPLLRSECLLGDALIRRGEIDEGMPLLERSIDGLEAHAGISQSHATACREALARARSKASS